MKIKAVFERFGALFAHDVTKAFEAIHRRELPSEQLRERIISNSKQILNWGILEGRYYGRDNSVLASEAECLQKDIVEVNWRCSELGKGDHEHDLEPIQDIAELMFEIRNDWREAGYSLHPHMLAVSILENFCDDSEYIQDALSSLGCAPWYYPEADLTKVYEGLTR